MRTSIKIVFLDLLRRLDCAKKVAHYFISNVPEEGLIPVDFRQPKEPLYYDDTAAAIAACDWSDKSDCFLTHCSGSYHGPKHNHTLVYADSYFLEALLKLDGSTFLLW